MRHMVALAFVVCASGIVALAGDAEKPNLSGLSLSNKDLKPYTEQRLEEEASGKRTDPVEGRYYKGARQRRRSRPATAAPTPFRARGIESVSEKRAKEVSRRSHERAEALNHDKGLLRHLAKDASKKQGRTVSPDEIKVQATRNNNITYSVSGQKASGSSER